MLACIATAVVARAEVPATLPAADVRPGDRAVVLTVFEGSTVDSFEAVILGTLDAGRSAGTTIYARSTTERAVRTGVAQGMSGSPVYVRGRLVGALSSGFAFSREPIFGITPIAEMLETFEHPDQTKSGDPSTGMSGADAGGIVARPRFGALRWAGDDSAAAPPPPTATPVTAAGFQRLALPLACGGLDPAALALARDWLAPYGLAAVPGGRAPSGAAPGADALVPGSAVAIDVLRGDLQLAAIGTLTWRDGDRLLLFGHPLFQSGDSRLPLATATIATIVPSTQLAFKLGSRGTEVGAVTQDRRAAVGARLGETAHMLPLSVSVRDGSKPGTSRYQFEMVEDRVLAPAVAAIAALNSFLESGGTAGGQTVRWRLELYRRGVPPLRLSDVSAGDSPSSDFANGIASPLRFLFGNPFSPLRLDSVRVAVDALPGRRSWSLRSARVLEPVVRPRGTVHVACEIEGWRGAIERRTLELRVPGDAPDGKYVLWLGGGTELAKFEAAHLPGRYRATSLDDAWQRIAAMRSSDALYAGLFGRAPELNADGRDYPELPSFALSLLSPERAAGDVSRRGDVAWLDERRLPVDGALRGELQLAVTVEARGSLAQP